MLDGCCGKFAVVGSVGNISMIDPARADTALLIIDVQNDFCPGGALAIDHGDAVVAPINAMSARFANIILTQDWHPPEHLSFAVNQPGKAPFETIPLPYGAQTLWPAHCIRATHGAAFHPQLDRSRAQLVVRKGFRPAIDSYSAFFENDHATATGLHGYLQERGISQVVLSGLATDFCVAWSAIDAAKLGLTATVILSACAAINLHGSLATQLQAMQAAGVKVEESL